MRTLTSLLCVLFLSLVALSANAETVQVYIPPDVLADYNVFLDGRDVGAIRDYSGSGSRRDVIEVVLFMQAIGLSSRTWQVEFIEEENYNAILTGLVEGKAVAAATSLWRSDLSERIESLYLTTGIISRGEFEAGLYTARENTRALAAETVADVKALKGVSSRHWAIDWETLQSIGANVEHAETWGEMVNNVLSGKRDYLLAPFQATPDLSLQLSEGTLVPIPNFKIGLVGTRHFAVSRNHEFSWLFNVSLHTGLMQLKRDGVVEKAFVDSGFWNRTVRDWTNITLVSR